MLTTASQTKLPLTASAATSAAKNRIEADGVAKRGWTRPASWKFAALGHGEGHARGRGHVAVEIARQREDGGQAEDQRACRTDQPLAEREQGRLGAAFSPFGKKATKASWTTK